VALVVALADKLETLIGMFGIGNLPTGDRDPFALRRHALGVVRMLIEQDLPLSLQSMIADGAKAFGTLITHDLAPLETFIQDRLAGLLKDQGFDARAIDAVLALAPQRLSDAVHRLEAVRSFTALPESDALAAANKRISNILKKANPSDIAATVSPALFAEPAESALANAIAAVKPIVETQLSSGDYTAALKALAALRDPVDAFFDGVMVNADEQQIRANRLALLSELHGIMNRVADLSRLAT
jgi:glycyl-tRNA synthetase beta chain